MATAPGKPTVVTSYTLVFKGGQTLTCEVAEEVYGLLLQRIAIDIARGAKGQRLNYGNRLFLDPISIDAIWASNAPHFTMSLSPDERQRLASGQDMETYYKVPSREAVRRAMTTKDKKKP